MTREIGTEACVAAYERAAQSNKKAADALRPAMRAILEAGLGALSPPEPTEGQIIERCAQFVESYLGATTESKRFGVEAAAQLRRFTHAHVPLQDHGQPMETAPKMGEILIQVERRAGIPNRFLVGHYQPGGHCIDDHPAIDEGWYFWNGCMFDSAAKPLRWWPLPAMVAEERGDG